MITSRAVVALLLHHYRRVVVQRAVNYDFAGALTDLICDAITMAAANVEIAPGAVFHSDRGTQYTSAQFAAHLSKHNMVGSMGRTGICWDNAMAESFFAALKNELIYRTAFPTRESARRAIADYIEVFYNRIRLHSGLGYRTPHEVATEYQKKQIIAA